MEFKIIFTKEELEWIESFGFFSNEVDEKMEEDSHYMDDTAYSITKKTPVALTKESHELILTKEEIDYIYIILFEWIGNDYFIGDPDYLEGDFERAKIVFEKMGKPIITIEKIKEWWNNENF